MSEDSFFSRWSRRKAQVREGLKPEDPAAVVSPEQDLPVADRRLPEPSARQEVPGPAPGEQPAQAESLPPPPTLEDVARLTTESDFSPFVARHVPSEVRNAAVKKLFSDPHFNVMDGLDIYIDDYGRADPLPASMLRQLVQARGLGLFREETPATPASAVADSGAAPPDADPAPAPAHDSESDPAPDAAAPPLPPDEDPDLQLQPHDVAGPDGDRRRAGQDPRRLD